MKIAIDVQTTLGHKTGFGSYVASLTQELIKAAPTDQFLLIKPGVSRDLSTPKRFLWDQFGFPRLANDQGADLLHQPCFSIPVFYHGKTVVTVHDLISMIYAQNITFWSRQFFGRWMPFTYRYADHIITISENTKRDVIRLLGLPAEKITVIPEGVGPEYQPVKNQAKLKTVRKKYALGDEPFILHVGTLEPRKNLTFLVRTFLAALPNFRQPVRLVITGKKGWYYQSIFKLVSSAQATDKVIFTDYVDVEDLPALYSAAAVFAFPSLYEGFGLPPLEAMACGTPVIASNTSSMPEVVADAGILLAPSDQGAWSEALIRVVNEPRLAAELSKKGLDQAARFQWHDCAEATIKVYDRVVNR